MASALADRIVARLAALPATPATSATPATPAGRPVHAEVRALTPIPSRGGEASPESWKVTLGLEGTEETFVLRGDARSPFSGTLDRAEEHAVVVAAVAAGVKTPSPRWLLRGLTRAGASSYFVPFVAGEARGRAVVAAPELAAARANLPFELAQQAARIHAITPTSPGAPTSFPGLKASEPDCDAAAASLLWLRNILDGLGVRRPAVELAFDWLTRTRPAPGPVVLVHGDFRVGNVLVAPEGLTAILDWELAHWGAPEEDLAWLCVRAFRFGRLTRPVGGVGQRASFYRAYAAASGRDVDPARVHWWEVLGNCRSAVGCALQAERYASRGGRDVELAAIGRRAAEREWEALRLIDFGPGSFPMSAAAGSGSG